MSVFFQLGAVTSARTKQANLPSALAMGGVGAGLGGLGGYFLTDEDEEDEDNSSATRNALLGALLGGGAGGLLGYYTGGASEAPQPPAAAAAPKPAAPQPPDRAPPSLWADLTALFRGGDPEQLATIARQQKALDDSLKARLAVMGSDKERNDYLRNLEASRLGKIPYPDKPTAMPAGTSVKRQAPPQTSRYGNYAENAKLPAKATGRAIPSGSDNPSRPMVTTKALPGAANKRTAVPEGRAPVAGSSKSVRPARQIAAAPSIQAPSRSYAGLPDLPEVAGRVPAPVANRAPASVDLSKLFTALANK